MEKRYLVSEEFFVSSVRLALDLWVRGEDGECIGELGEMAQCVMDEFEQKMNANLRRANYLSTLSKKQ